MKDPLESCSIVIDRPVRWGEMDAFGHVNNTVYFGYFEDARIEYLRAVGLAGGPDEEAVGPILAHTSCRFRLPLTYPDRVRIGTGVTEVQEDRFVMRYLVVSEAHGRLAAEGEGRVVTFDYRRGRKAPLPAKVLAAIVEMDRGMLRRG